MKQVKLRSNNFEMTCWVDELPTIMEGNFLTLKNDERKWEIIKVYETSIEKKELHKPWKVGGY